MISELYIFVLSFLLQLRSKCFVCFCFRCIFSKGNQYIYSTLAQLYLFIKVNLLFSLAKAWEVEMRVFKCDHFKLASAPMFRQFFLLWNWAKLQNTGSFISISLTNKTCYM